MKLFRISHWKLLLSYFAEREKRILYGLYLTNKLELPALITTLKNMKAKREWFCPCENFLHDAINEYCDECCRKTSNCVICDTPTLNSQITIGLCYECYSKQMQIEIIEPNHESLILEPEKNICNHCNQEILDIICNNCSDFCGKCMSRKVNNECPDCDKITYNIKKCQHCNVSQCPECYLPITGEVCFNCLYIVKCVQIIYCHHCKNLTCTKKCPLLGKQRCNYCLKKKIHRDYLCKNCITYGIRCEANWCEKCSENHFKYYNCGTFVLEDNCI